MSEPGVSDLLTVAQAIAIIDATPVSPRVIEVPLQEAQRLRLAEDLHADRNYPPFDKSLMDGFAVRCADLAQAGAQLKVVGEIAAGKSTNQVLQPGEAMAIMTGAPIPNGSDCVVPVEETSRTGELVRISGTSKAGKYIAKSGSVTFNPGETSKPITISVIGDTIPEPNKAFFVNLTSAVNATIGDGQGLGTIIDDDPISQPTVDFDGDGKSDVGIYRNGTWSIIRSIDGGVTSVGWGGPTWVPVPADYDGDGKIDIAVYNASGLWSIVRSSDGVNVLIGWSGAPGDIPVPADYDGDGKADLAVYNTTTGGWSIIRSSDGGLTYKAWGGPAWMPVMADYDGDGKADIAVYNANGLWSIVRSSDGGNTLIGWSGAANDVPVPADYDGDGKADFAVYNTATAGWSIIRSSDGGLTYKAWGGPAWEPVPADYDGDGKADIAVYNASIGLWSIVRSSDGANILVGLGGAPQDIPLN
jgi:hypothetical protein